MLMYSFEAQSSSMIRKIDQQCQQDVVVPFYDPRNGSAFRTPSSRSESIEISDGGLEHTG